MSLAKGVFFFPATESTHHPQPLSGQISSTQPGPKRNRARDPTALPPDLFPMRRPPSPLPAGSQLPRRPRVSRPHAPSHPPPLLCHTRRLVPPHERWASSTPLVQSDRSHSPSSNQQRTFTSSRPQHSLSHLQPTMVRISFGVSTEEKERAGGTRRMVRGGWTTASRGNGERCQVPRGWETASWVEAIVVKRMGETASIGPLALGGFPPGWLGKALRPPRSCDSGCSIRSGAQLDQTPPRSGPCLFILARRSRRRGVGIIVGGAWGLTTCPTRVKGRQRGQQDEGRLAGA